MVWPAAAAGAPHESSRGCEENAMIGSKQLDLVLINPGSRTQVYQSLGSKLAAVENPVWAGLMATFCHRKGLSVAVIDAEADVLVAAEVAERVQVLDPVLAAVVAFGHQPEP